jgi:hypothetical protein
MPQTWNNHISIRAGLLVQSEKEFNENEQTVKKRQTWIESI